MQDVVTRQGATFTSSEPYSSRLNRARAIPRSLFHTQDPGAPLLNSLLLLLATVKGGGGGVVTANVVKVLDLVDSDDPVLASESLLDGVEDRSSIRQSHAADAILRLSGGEEGVVVVVRHLVPGSC